MTSKGFEIYRYSPLPSKHCIRLLRQVEEDKVAPLRIFDHYLLQFTFEVIDINDEVEYEALSYTWGSSRIPTTGGPDDRSSNEQSDAEKRFPIAVDGKLLFVTANLYDALQQLCSESDSAVLVDDKYPPWEKSKLILEAEAGKVHKVAHWIGQGATLDLQDCFGNTALHYAAENGFLDTVKLLLDAGANTELRDNRQRSALDCCLEARRRQHEAVEKLLRTYSNEQTPFENKHRKPPTRQRLSRKWIDALCINQDDIRERNDQVSQIHNVYQHATRVAVWLGKLDDDDFDFVYPQPFDLNWFRYSLEILAYQNCMWFRRVWTVQEVAMARDVRMLYGSHELTILHPDAVPKPTSAAVVHRRPIDDTPGAGIVLWAERNADKIEDTLKSPVQTESSILWAFEREHSWPSILAMTFNLRATNPRDKIFAIRGLVKSFHESSFVKVDYGCDIAELYLQIGREFIMGDYPPSCDSDGGQESTADIVTTRTKRHHASAIDGLGYNQKSMGYPKVRINTLSLVAVDNQNRMVSLDLPTWCPDFRLNTQSPLVDYLGFNATGDSQPKFRPGDAQTINLDGTILDEVVRLEATENSTYSTSTQPPDATKVIHEYAKFLALLRCKYSKMYPTAESRAIALIKTLTMSHYSENMNINDHIDFNNPDAIFNTNEELALILWILENGSIDIAASTTDAEQHSDEDQIDKYSKEELSSLLCFCESVKPYTKLSTLNDVNLAAFVLDDLHDEHFLRRRGRVVFLTKRGYLGLGLRSVKLGDRIVLVRGGHVPYALRPNVDEDDEGGEMVYSYVGDAYIYGIMYGETYQSKKVSFEPIRIQ